MIYAIESYAEIVEDIKPLLVEHWEEIAVNHDAIPLGPDFDFYKRLNEAGSLIFYAARQEDKLVGYGIYYLTPSHPHYKTSFWAVSDIVFIHPDYRNAGFAKGLFSFIERDLIHRGVNVIMTGTKVAHPALATLLKSLDYFPIDITFGKLLCPL